MRKLRLWVRWSLRDLRRRWLVVAALALVIAIGTGAAAAFGSLSEWRRLSNDSSFALLGMHDLRVSFPETGVPADRAIEAVTGIEHASSLDVVRARLDLATQVEVVTEGKRAVLPGRVVGIDLTGGGPLVDRVDPVAGRALAPADAAADRPVAVLETGFAERYRLPATGRVRVAGGAEIEYVGLGRSPSYLLNGDGAWFGEPTQAVLFLPLTSAQRVMGTNLVNEVLVTVRSGSDPRGVRSEIAEATRRALPEAPSTVTGRDDDATYRALYRDIDNDQQMWNVIALLVLGGAALATFNLANRVITAQRREIGVGMALGLPTPALALRPLLFGAQVALLGTIAGVGVGALLGWAITGILDDLLPLPRWRTPFQAGPFVRAAALGLGIPVLGVAYPVLRAVRMTPSEAIRTAHVAGGVGLASRALRRVRLPGSSIGKMPLRYLSRSPARTALTAAGIGAAITVMVAMLGILDSFSSSMAVGERELARGAPGRTIVSLDTFRPLGDPVISEIANLPEVAKAQPGLRLTGKAHGSRHEVELIIDVLDFKTAMWTPSRSGSPATATSGIVLAEKAADDLGVRPGDQIRLEHPRRAGPAGLATVTSSIRVAAVHPHPMRAFAYLDVTDAGIFNMAGVANQVQVAPKPGVSEARLRGALLGNRAIGAVGPVTATSRAMRDMMAQFADVIRLASGFVLLLALLIAFNAATVSADERAREHATMFAFGLTTRTVLRNSMLESLIIGLLGTGFGLVAGTCVTWWMASSLLSDTIPDLAITTSITGGTILSTLGVGVLAVTVAPLLTVRRLRRTNIPATLRVVE